jgi:C1A family cysteine protease
MPEEVNYQLGCLKDPTDSNDLLLSQYIIPNKLPKAIDWFQTEVPVLDQGNLPACVGYASVALKQNQEKIDENKILNFSGLDLYKRCKEIDEMPGVDGTNIRWALKVLQEEGIPEANGDIYKIGAYTRVTTLEELKYSLVSNGFALLGVRAMPRMFNPKDGVVFSEEGDVSKGGHCILVGGYDDYSQRITFKNSWGPAWGLSGYGYLTYEYFNKNLTDGWTAVDIFNEHPTVASTMFDINKLKEDLINVTK